MRFALLLALATLPAVAADAKLDALRATVIAMRNDPKATAGPRGATPQWTVAKHQLREWVEARLTHLPQRGDEAELAKTLNAELRGAGLICEEGGAVDCPEWTLSGYVDVVKLQRRGVFILLQTGLGIECGFDQSAYLYSWSSDRWNLVWQTEQNTYTKEKYKPQSIEDVLVSPSNRANRYVVLTLGTEPWCASNWHDVYYRAFRVGGDLEARPIVEGSQWSFLGDDPPISGSVTADEVLVEYNSHSIDTGFLVRKVIRHYRIDGDTVERVAPLALGPRDFVDEWLANPWNLASHWSESAHRPALAVRHDKIRGGSFTDPTLHCPATPDLWQVGLTTGKPEVSVYFLVRWRPPYNFSLLQIRDTPSPACTEKDPAADEPRTLFPR